jgi:translocation and assembly module TamA
MLYCEFIRCCHSTEDMRDLSSTRPHPARLAPIRTGLLALQGLILFLGSVGIAGCGAKRQPTGTQIRNIRFEGNGPPLTARGTSTLRNAMAHPVPRGLPGLRSKVPLDEETLEADRTRLAVYYAERGYFDATIAWETETVRDATDERPPVVAITGHIDEGPRYSIETAEIEGLDGVDRPPEAPSGPFTLSGYTGFEDAGRRALENDGHAYAEAEGEVRVDRSQQRVDIEMRFDPGPTATFGEVTLDGAEGMPEGIVWHAIHIEPGAPYDPRRLEQTRRELYGLGAFSYVTISPDLSRADTDAVVPVAIEVERRRPRSITGGVGVNLQSGRQEALLRAQFDHLDAFDRLVRLRAGAAGGYALLASSLDDLTDPSGVRRGIVVDAEIGMTVPGIGPAGFELDAETAFDRRLTEAFVVNQPTFTLSYAGPLSQLFRVSLAYRLRYARYADVQISSEALRLQTGNLDLAAGEYFVTELEESVVLDTRDDPLAPSEGVRNQLTLTQAGRFLGGNYDYLGARLDLRAYRGLGEVPLGSLVLAGRLGGGGQLPYGPDARRAVPVAERLYLGGAESVRGWIFQHLGPYICDLESAPCSSEGRVATREDDIVPIGGTLATWASLELRATGERFGIVGFTDWGMVWEGPDAVSRTPVVAPSVGVGGRLVTPAGPIRLDVAARTGNQKRYRSEPRAWVHLGIGEAF